MQKVQKKVWHLIDDDSAQYVSYLDPAAGTTGKVFDFAQVTALPDGYVISKEVVDVGAYTDADIEDTIKLFGYNDLDDFVDQNSPVVIRKLPDGTLDKEDAGYIIDYALIAEFIFECEAFDCIVSSKFDTFDAAAEKVREIILNDGVVN